MKSLSHRQRFDGAPGKKVLNCSSCPVPDPGGRISQSDLDNYIASGGSVGQSVSTGLCKKPGTEDIKVIGLRRTIAMRMQDAKRRIPHFSYIEEVDVTDLEELRARTQCAMGQVAWKVDPAAVPRKGDDQRVAGLPADQRSLPR